MHFLYFYTLPRLLETLLENGTGHIRAQNSFDIQWRRLPVDLVLEDQQSKTWFQSSVKVCQYAMRCL